MQGFQAIPKLIQNSGSEVVFGMIAGTNAPYLAYGIETGAFRLVKTRHEDTAVTAAISYGRVTGSLGIASVQRGPGFANSINAMIVGASAHSPMLLLVAESPATTDITGKGELDQGALCDIIGVGFHHAATAADLERTFVGAVEAAMWNGRPQVLSIGDGILVADVNLIGMKPSTRSESSDLDSDSLRAAVDALEQSERPLIIAGQGAVLSNCRSELEELAELTGARVCSSLYGASFFSGHPSNLGLCGTWASPLTQAAIADTDVVLAVGASLNRYTTMDGTAFGGAQVIHCEVDIDQPARSSSPQLALLGDGKATVTAILQEWNARGLGARAVTGSVAQMSTVRESILAVDVGHSPARGLDPRHVYSVLDRRLPSDRIVVTDSGRYLKTIPSLVSAQDARSFVVSRGYGSVGMGMGAAIGAAVGGPGRHVVLFCGDGGFTMASQALDTIRYNELSVTIVIMNDLMYGAEVKYLRSFGLPFGVLEMGFPDVVSLGHAYGGSGSVVRTMAELEAVELSGVRLTILDVRIDPESDASAAVG
jgi:thiamine pyrophosphate-dependent acetolactate synthase large subunit-like protein